MNDVIIKPLEWEKQGKKKYAAKTPYGDGSWTIEYKLYKGHPLFKHETLWLVECNYQRYVHAIIGFKSLEACKQYCEDMHANIMEALYERWFV